MNNLRKARRRLVYRTHMGVSETGGTLLGGPYNKDPTI